MACRYVGIILCALTLSACSQPEVRPGPMAPISELAFRIEQGGTVCSATAIGPSKLLTSSHCLADYPLLLVNGTAAGVVSVVHDGNDHAVVVVTMRFLAWAKVVGPPALGEVVEYHGNPLRFHQLYRRGYVAGVDRTGVILDVNGYNGDSGAGVFNTKGEVVGVISGLTRGEFRVIAMFPFAFKGGELL